MMELTFRTAATTTWARSFSPPPPRRRRGHCRRHRGGGRGRAVPPPLLSPRRRDRPDLAHTVMAQSVRRPTQSQGPVPRSTWLAFLWRESSSSRSLSLFFYRSFDLTTSSSSLALLEPRFLFNCGAHRLLPAGRLAPSQGSNRSGEVGVAGTEGAFRSLGGRTRGRGLECPRIRCEMRAEESFGWRSKLSACSRDRCLFCVRGGAHQRGHIFLRSVFARRPNSCK